MREVHERHPHAVVVVVSGRRLVIPTEDGRAGECPATAGGGGQLPPLQEQLGSQAPHVVGNSLAIIEQASCSLQPPPAGDMRYRMRSSHVAVTPSKPRTSVFKVASVQEEDEQPHVMGDVVVVVTGATTSTCDDDEAHVSGLQKWAPMEDGNSFATKRQAS